ncbi:hypothetical protein PRK78_004123 [Emydomyces testavorans]|uniref:C2H2-type domain-containing protein n=1 Tax=Emydomyces testavorans TaxID=2070801 RepID=A0AAF0DKK1_9EURO|nr:hypothetical protein PRK78_004123 [Emydomyces testavorans]
MNALEFTDITDLTTYTNPDAFVDKFNPTFSPDLASVEDILIDSTEYLCRTGTSDLTNGTDLTRPARMEKRISSLEQSVAGNHAYPTMDHDPHGAHYLPIQNTAPPQPPPTQTTRYASPSGSLGGDGSATGSLISEQSWMMLHNHFQSGSPSPMIDSFQFMGLFSPASLMPTMEGSYCGSEYSVNPLDLQHYPDPTQQINTPPPEVDPMATSYNDSIHCGQGITQTYMDHIPHFSYPNTQHDVDTLFRPHLEPEEAAVEPPRKRMKFEEPSGHSSEPALQMETPPESPKKKSKPATSSSKPKRPLGKRGNNKHQARPPPTIAPPWNIGKKSERQFPCVFSAYGCDLILVSKNEWKRHVLSKHIQLGFYRCDVGNCNVSGSNNRTCSPSTPPDTSSCSSFNRSSTTTRAPNDFNRKDLFTQHQRRMHAPWRVPASPVSSSAPTPSPPTKRARDDFDASLKAVYERCWIDQRKPPQYSQCTYCPAEFKGAGCWEARMEHVGKHCENGHAVVREDMGLREWALKEGIVQEVRRGKLELVMGQRAGRRGGGGGAGAGMGRVVCFE